MPIETRNKGSEAWWRAENGKAHEQMFALMQQLKGYEHSRRREDALHMALYGDKMARNYIGGGRVRERLRERKDRLSFNLVKAVIDAAQSTIAAQNTRARVLTQRGNWGLQQKAKAMEMAIDGEFDRNDVIVQSHDCFLDAAKLGTTALKVSCSGGRPLIERVPPGELVVDPVDGQHRKPRGMYQVCLVDKDVAMGLWGKTEKLKAIISDAPRADSTQLFPWLPRDTSLNQIEIVEGWRLQDPSDWATNFEGRHVIACKGATLLDEKWERSSFPFAIWRYDHESTGFWGRGMAHNLRAMQRELNYLLVKMQECVHKSAGYRVFIQGSANAAGGATATKITNSPGEIVWLKNGEVISSVTDNTIPPEMRQMVEDIIRRGFEQEGVSMMGAFSRKPQGLDSGAALREFQDIESGRFATKAKSFERFIGVHLARLVVAEKRRIAEYGKEEPVRAEVRRGRGVAIKKIEWKDADLDDDQYTIRVFPSSALPNTPAGRIATIESWINAGLIGRDQALQLLDFPDLEEFTATELAPHEIVLDAVERMIEDGEYVPPEPIQNLELSKKLVQNAYQRFRIDGAPEERTELLLRYFDDCEALVQDALAQEQAAAAPPGGGGLPAGVVPGQEAMPPEAVPPMPAPTPEMVM